MFNQPSHFTSLAPKSEPQTQSYDTFLSSTPNSNILLKSNANTINATDSEFDNGSL